MMRFEYDKEVDAAYIYFEYPVKEGQASNTVQANDNIVLDYDDHGKLLGIEILNAKKVLKSKSLLEAIPL